MSLKELSDGLTSTAQRGATSARASVSGTPADGHENQLDDAVVSGTALLAARLKAKVDVTGLAAAAIS